VPQIRTRTGRTAPEVIVEAALELFGRRGVTAVSLGAIAEEIGVTKAAIYHHFKTKDALVLSAFAPVLEQIAALVAREGPVEARIDDLITLAVEHRELLLLAQPHAVDGIGPGARRVLDTATSALITSLSPEATDEARTRAAMVLASTCAVVGDPHSTPQSVAELRRVARVVIALDERAHR
jgi:AcrR family transcriptional regulator